MSDKNDVKKDIAYFEMQGEMSIRVIEWFPELYRRYLESCREEIDECLKADSRG